MIPKKINCSEAKRMDIVTYLESLSIKPQKVTGNDYWYLSPLRDEKTPSFKINRKLNVWYDHGLGKGGKLVDLGILLHHCSVPEFLEKLNTREEFFSFHQQPMPLQKSEEFVVKKIKLIAANPLTDPILCHYLETRNIPADIAKKYCQQVIYMNGEKQSYAIGFKNNSGGFELRSPNFKSTVSPKDFTFLNAQDWDAVAVFEGFTDFLSLIVSGDSKKQSSWVTRSKGFSSMDYSKLALELTSPDYIKHFYHLPEHKKTEVLQSQSMLYKGINFSLIDRIYDKMYELAEDFGEIPARLLTNMELRNVTEKKGKYLLDFFHQQQEKHYRQSADIVIFATGYQNTFPDFFAPVKERICWKDNGDLDIAFNYSIDVNRSEIFVQNAELLTHGFNAPDLGMGPHRNAIIINTILGYEYYQVEKNVAFQNFGV